MSRRRFRAIIKNPLVIIAPLVVVLLLGWSHYVQSGRDLALPENNLLANGGFDKFGAGNVPAGWTVTPHGSFDYTTAQAKGYVSGKSFALKITNYKDGDLELQSPKVKVQPDQTYLYKGFYLSRVDFNLLVRYYYTDGSSKLRLAQDYSSLSDPWTTDSTAFDSGKTVQAVQFVYRLASNGSLRLDDTYLEKDKSVYVAPPTATTKNLIPNNNLSRNTKGVPTDWLTYHSGNNQASFTYVPGKAVSYVHATLANYKSGEAKWQYVPQAVKPAQYFSFGMSYRSSAPVDVVAEYVLADGKHQFITLDTLMPASTWTQYAAKFETPEGAKTMFVAVVLHQNGDVDTTDYNLQNITKPGPRHFARPLVSLTFDDGWESAYKNGAPLMDQYGYKGTFYLNPSTVDTSNFMTTAQILALQRRGEELASHGVSHLDMTTVNAAQLNYQFKTSATYIRQKTSASEIDFATPYGKSDAEVQWYARKYYASVRSTDSGINTRQNFNPYDLKVLYIGGNTPLQIIAAIIAQTKAENGWLVLVYHRIENNAEPEGESTVVSPDSFFKQLDAIKQSGVTVKPVDAALQEVESQL